MVNKLRSILIKLIYNSKVNILEDNLTSSNIGARKNKAPRDHLYVLLAIVNDVITTKNKDPIEIVYYDVKQAFDSLWTEKSYLDLHENGLNDDMLTLLHETSKEVEICVKSPVGVTEKGVIRDIILQGETVSSIICTSSVDLMSKQCPLEVYKYREVVDIPKLSFVDDIADVTKCGKSAKDMNEFTSIEISKRKLQLATDKCQKVHVGREQKCAELTKDEWKVTKEKVNGVTNIVDKYKGKSTIETVEVKEYLGTYVACDGTNAKTIEMKVGRGQGIVNDIMMILSSIPLGKYYFETAVLLRSYLLLSVLTHDIEVLHNITKSEIKKT